MPPTTSYAPTKEPVPELGKDQKGTTKPLLTPGAENAGDLTTLWKPSL